jgi:hypothetical protein
MPAAVPPTLTPVQARTMAELRDGARPAFPAELGPRLRHDLETGLAPVLEDLGPDEVLPVSKHVLGEVHGCEVKLVVEAAAPFTPSIPVVRGAVAHKAIELGIHWRGEPIPLDLVDDAIARLTDAEVWLSDFLQRCTRADLAELRSTAGDRVSKFFECFPPLKASWRPVTESSQHVDLLDGRVVLRGKVDLTLGTPAGLTAGKVVIDLKTGAPSPRHRDDLRFYALLDAIRLGVPPRLVASFYLDQGEARTEAVTEGVLDAAVARTVDGARRWAALQAGTAAPVHRPSPGCRWCGIRATCEPGRAWLGDDAEAAGELLAVGDEAG